MGGRLEVIKVAMAGWLAANWQVAGALLRLGDGAVGDRPRLSVECLSWNAERASFAVAAIDRFRHMPDGWVRNCVAGGS